MSKVRALYDFSAEPGSTELSIVAGEILTVTRTDVGEGWLEGRNVAGSLGLFPAAYVEEVGSEPPSMPPPPPPGPVYSEPPESNEWGNMNEWQSGTTPQDHEEWDDDWDDDSETGTSQPVQSQSMSTVNTINRDLKGGTVGKKSLNRFSSFVKSGGESYILGTLKLNVNIKEPDYVVINAIGDGVEWCPIDQPYSCVIVSTKKESKMNGLKSYIAYQLTPTFNNIQVSRRYKQFDWLHERLQLKYSGIAIPPLPDKQISGRYEDTLIAHRKTQLQAFVNCVCRHPVLSRSPVWLHFITCTDKKQWKAGKRRAEHDELVGAKFFMAVRAPARELEAFLVEQESEKCDRFIREMDVAVKGLADNAVDQSKRFRQVYSRDMQKVARSFKQLADAFKLDGTPGNPTANLNTAITTTSDIYTELGQLMDDQPKYDWEPLCDVLHIYKGLIGSFPDILNLHRSALDKRKECERLASSEITAVRQRTDVVSYALMAEINHFHQERATDFKMAMHGFLSQQIEFYQRIVDNLKVALNAYEY